MNNAEAIYDFLNNTILGQESGLYKIIGPDTYKMDPEATFTIIKADYYNTIYKALILGNDDYVNKVFDQINTDHSKICVLHILFHLDKMIHSLIPRRQEYSTDYNLWMNYIKIQLEKVKSLIIEQIGQMFSHKCSGIDIKTCNPDEPLFFFKPK